MGTEKPRESKSPKTQPKISDALSSLIVKTTLPINDKYAYSPVNTSILKITIVHSQNVSTVLKITNKNNNNNINFQQNVSTVSKSTKNINNNCRESNNNNIILQPTRKDFIKYLQLEPELQQLPANSYWMYNVIQSVNILCLLKLYC